MNNLLGSDKSKNFGIEFKPKPDWLNIICRINRLLRKYINTKKVKYTLIADINMYFDERKKRNRKSNEVEYCQKTIGQLSGIKLVDATQDINQEGALEIFESAEECFLANKYSNVFELILDDLDDCGISWQKKAPWFKNISKCESFAELELHLNILGI